MAIFSGIHWVYKQILLFGFRLTFGICVVSFESGLFVYLTISKEIGRATRYSFAYKLQMQVTFDWKQFEMISSLAWSFLSCLPSAGTPSTPAEYLLFSMPAPHLRFTHTKGMCGVYWPYVQNVCVWRA